VGLAPPYVPWLALLLTCLRRGAFYVALAHGMALVCCNLLALTHRARAHRRALPPPCPAACGAASRPNCLARGPLARPCRVRGGRNSLDVTPLLWPPYPATYRAEKVPPAPDPSVAGARCRMRWGWGLEPTMNIESIRAGQDAQRWRRGPVSLAFRRW